MQPVLTAAQSRAFDKYLIKEIGIPALVLMENAARGVISAIEDWLDTEIEIVIICGTGNNGGDGMAVARLLIERSQNVTVFLAGNSNKLSGDALLQYEALSNILDPDEIYSFEKSEDILEITDTSSIVIDALLGTGSKGIPSGIIAEGVKAIQLLQETGARVVSVDIPTGLDADLVAFEDIEGSELIVRADKTVTMAAPKIGFYQGDSKDFTGVVSVAGLGADFSFPEGSEKQSFLVSAKIAADGIRKFNYTSSKFTRGRVLAICGSRGMTGAAIMSGMAALKSGCGMVTVAIPESERAIVAQAMPELMTVGLKNENNGSPDIKAWEELKSYFNRTEAVLIGCGLPVILGTTALILRIISEVDKPMVIDAGALGTLTGKLDVLKKRTAATILTPHAGEIARLIDRPVKEVERDRLNVAREVAAITGSIVIMKGAPTYVVKPDGAAFINTTGNVGLATAGSGDVLSGITASLLAQMPDNPLEAAMSAVYLHGLAGDFAAKEKTTHSMTATDIIAYLPHAFKSLGVE